MKTIQIKGLPANAVLLGAKGYRKNGEGVTIVKYVVNGEIFTAWIPWNNVTA